MTFSLGVGSFLTRLISGPGEGCAVDGSEADAKTPYSELILVIGDLITDD